MTKRRPVIAATFSLTMLAIGLAATTSGAQRYLPSKTSNTTTATPATYQSCYGGGSSCPRTKNAALPATTTTRPRTVTTPMPTVNTIMRTKNAALPTTTVAPKGKGKGKGTVNIPVSGG